MSIMESQITQITELCKLNRTNAEIASVMGMPLSRVEGIVNHIAAGTYVTEDKKFLTE
tara:strand:- start:807 stop:980 length:174 start_codon:yes stop_codon:yes gene_type:complete